MDAETNWALNELRGRIDRELSAAGRDLVRPASGSGAGSGGLRPRYVFPAIPTVRTEIIFMRGCDFAATPFDPDIIAGSGGGFVWRPGVIDGLWWASPGDDFWKPWGGKLAFHRGRPGTYYIYYADRN